MNTAEILRAAAQRVRQGWCQGQMFDSNGVCALGAIESIELDWLSSDAIATVAEEALGLIKQDSGRLRPLAWWNDADGQTAENVAQGLELAALLWEQEQAQHAEAPREVQAV